MLLFWNGKKEVQRMNESDWVEYDEKCEKQILEDCPEYTSKLNDSWRGQKWN